MQNIGEQLVGDYLKAVKGCDFIEYNLYTPDIQGEIDVVGIDIRSKKIYICEVALHLITGLQYVKDGQPDNVNRFYKKFSKNIEFAEKHFGDFEKHFMLWSPIVKNSRETAKNNQLKDVMQIKKLIANKYGHTIELIINHEFLSCINALKTYARKETKELKSPVLRLLQIEEKLEGHLKRFKQ